VRHLGSFDVLLLHIFILQSSHLSPSQHTGTPISSDTCVQHRATSNRQQRRPLSGGMLHSEARQLQSCSQRMTDLWLSQFSFFQCLTGPFFWSYSKLGWSGIGIVGLQLLCCTLLCSQSVRLLFKSSWELEIDPLIVVAWYVHYRGLVSFSEFSKHFLPFV